ncbi:MAG: 5'-nucleotidase C-terminal domain-containing protein [Acidobacteriota bacterium]
MRRLIIPSTILLFALAALLSPVWADDEEENSAGHKITFIHTSDLHGDMHSHPNLREDSNGQLEGGLARVFTVIKKIRKNKDRVLYINTGDTIQGSAEAMFTRGQSMVDVLNLFGIDAYVPGNWEFVYGVPRFLELFADPNPRAPWNTIAANAYYTGEAPFSQKAPGTRLLPPYRVKNVGGIKIGFLGLTTNRGPQIVSRKVTQGVVFSSGEGITIDPGTPTNPADDVVVEPEVPSLIKLLREKEKVDLVVMLSELGLAQNIYLAEKYSGIDIVFSSDMHEETKVPVVTSTGTILIEEGEDGAQVGELEIKVKRGKISKWKWTAHEIDERVEENSEIAAKIEAISRPFLSGPDFVPGAFVNPFNGRRLEQPIDTVVGYTEILLSRNNFSQNQLPALIEGSGHDFLTDAFRVATSAQIGAIRGFRFTNTIPPGPITLEDIYHYIPIGPQIAIGQIRGQQLNAQVENTANGTMNPDVTKWTGGWLFNFSGITFDINPYKALALTPISAGRAFNFKVGGVPMVDSDANTIYTYASYFYAADPTLINGVDVIPGSIMVLTREGLLPPAQVTPNNVMDATEVVVAYLASLPNKTVTAANTPIPRITLVKPLPAPLFGFPEIQPLRGVPTTD